MMEYPEVPHFCDEARSTSVFAVMRPHRTDCTAPEASITGEATMTTVSPVARETTGSPTTVAFVSRAFLK